MYIVPFFLFARIYVQEVLFISFLILNQPAPEEILNQVQDDIQGSG